MCSRFITGCFLLLLVDLIWVSVFINNIFFNRNFRCYPPSLLDLYSKTAIITSPSFRPISKPHFSCCTYLALFFTSHGIEVVYDVRVKKIVTRYWRTRTRTRRAPSQDTLLRVTTKSLNYLLLMKPTMTLISVSAFSKLIFYRVLFRRSEKIRPLFKNLRDSITA